MIRGTKTSASAGGYVLNNIFRIPADATEQRRRQRVEKEQSHEVQPRHVSHDSAFVPWIFSVFLLTEDREIDPGKIGPEPRAPDHVRYLQEAVISHHGQAVLHAHHFWDRWIPASVMSWGLTRTRRPALVRKFDRALRPMGVPKESTF